jgi:hypothetical protein
MAKKKRFKKPETDEEELAKFREHIKMINEKTKQIVNKYRKTNSQQVPNVVG